MFLQQPPRDIFGRFLGCFVWVTGKWAELLCEVQQLLRWSYFWSGEAKAVATIMCMTQSWGIPYLEEFPSYVRTAQKAEKFRQTVSQCKDGVYHNLWTTSGDANPKHFWQTINNGKTWCEQLKSQKLFSCSALPYSLPADHKQEFVIFLFFFRCFFFFFFFYTACRLAANFPLSCYPLSSTEGIHFHSTESHTEVTFQLVHVDFSCCLCQLFGFVGCSSWFGEFVHICIHSKVFPIQNSWMQNKH